MKAPTARSLQQTSRSQQVSFISRPLGVAEAEKGVLVDVPTYRSTSSTRRLNPFQLLARLSGIGFHRTTVSLANVAPLTTPAHVDELVMNVGMDPSSAASRLNWLIRGGAEAHELGPGAGAGL